MRVSTLIPTAFAVGALAAPLKDLAQRDLVTDVIVEVITITTTIWGPSPAPEPTSTSVVAGGNFHHHHSWSGHPSFSIPATSIAPAQPTSTPIVAPPSSPSAPAPTSSPAAVTPSPSPSPPPSPSSSSAAAPAPVSTSAANPPATTGSSPPPPSVSDTPDFTVVPVTGGVSILDTLNKWRRTYGITADLTWDSQVANNAWKTVVANNGGDIGQLFHPGLGDGSYAEVIGPGPYTGDPANLDNFTPFEFSILDGWLCEVPTDSELAGICSATNKIMGMRYDSTGHHDILTSTSYHTVGCEFGLNPTWDGKSVDQGIWVCDFGF